MKKRISNIVLASLIGLHSAGTHAADVDVVHFWISASEASALDVYRQAWISAGNRWFDFPAQHKVAVQQTIADRVASGYPPAVMQWHANEGARELPEMAIVQDIEVSARLGHWRDVLPAFVLERISYQDKIYFAPSNIHAENWLWTSQRLFDELGLMQPSSWEDIFASAEHIQAAGYLPIALGGGAWEISVLFNNLMYYTMGAEDYTRIIGAHAEAVLDDRMVEALNMLRRISHYTESHAARAGKSWADATAMVGRGEAGMQFMGDWAKGELIALGYTVDEDFGCLLAPGTSIAYFMAIDAFAFPLSSREGTHEAQQAFAQLIMDRDNQAAFSRVKGSLPVRTDVDLKALDRCGQLGMQMIAHEKHRINSPSMAMPAHMSEGWISVLADFFHNYGMSSREAQQRLYQIIKQG